MTTTTMVIMLLVFMRPPQKAAEPYRGPTLEKPL
jgi:hypothetical protein